MSMLELVIGAALGFVLAQIVLYGISHLLGWLRTGKGRNWSRALLPVPGSAIFAFFVRYAGPIGVSAALLLMGAWAVSDYLKARAAHNAAMTSTFDSAPAATTGDTPEANETAAAAPAAPASPAVPAGQLRHTALVAVASPPPAPDPYADPDFKVRRKSHKAATTLKETLLEKSEARARADLLRETQQHMQRSQYDCEAADRAAKYVAANLDVWGFSSWQMKYFPATGYKGATLPQCKDMASIVDPSWLNLQSALVPDEHP